jgi:hypothetical protein
LGKTSKDVRVEVATGNAPKGLDLIEMKFSTGDLISLRAEENPIHLVKRTEGPSFPKGEAPRTLSAALNDEADSLGHALNSRSDQQLFRQAAACAWPLLRQVLLEIPTQ